MKKGTHSTMSSGGRLVSSTLTPSCPWAMLGPSPCSFYSCPLPVPSSASTLPGPGDSGPFFLSPQPLHTLVPAAQGNKTGAVPSRRGQEAHACYAGEVGGGTNPNKQRQEGGNQRAGPGTSQADRSRAGIETRKAIVKGCQSRQPPSENSDQNRTV